MAGFVLRLNCPRLAGLSSRLMLAFSVSLIFAFVPYFGPMLSIGHLVNPNCSPNEGRVGPCVVYGGNVGSVAHDTVFLSWWVFRGAPVALAAFGLYVLFVLRRAKAFGLKRGRFVFKLLLSGSPRACDSTKFFCQLALIMA